LVWLPDQEHLTGDYHTISASGIVRMFASGAPAEFIPLGDWVREHSVFNMMKQVWCPCPHALAKVLGASSLHA
jgi:hypothetical protein